MSGCGNTYRPVVAAINPVGPSAQPTKYAVVASSPSDTSPGLVTIVDFSGDSVLITANIGVKPTYLALSGSTTGYTLNSDGTVSSFDISPSLLTSQVLYTTLLSNPPATPNSLFAQGTNTYITEPGRSAVAQLTGTSPITLQQEFSITNPVYTVGVATSPRVYVLSAGADSTMPGTAVALETATNTHSADIPVGKNPVYGIMTADFRRAFIMNKGDNTVTVINSQTNQLDTLPGSTSSAPISTIPVGTAPVWADFAPSLNEMVVANAGDGTTPGTASIVSIPLCNAAAITSNPNCDVNNPIDAAGFGTVLAQPQVGINPIMDAVLQDGTQAYVANAGDLSKPCVDANGAATGNCSVSVINLQSNTVTATIPIAGRPVWIAATTGTPTGKVYVVCSDSKNMTVIRTDTDSIDTMVPLQGNGVSVRVTAP